MKQFLYIFLFISMLLPLAASTITFDPDDYSAGTNISTLGTGITLSLSGTGSVYAVANANHSTGSNVFGLSSTSGNWHGSPSVGSNYLRVDFSHAVNYVAIDIIANDSSDKGYLEVYGTNGLITQIISNVVSTTGTKYQTLSYTSVSNIAYIITSGINGETIELDHLVYSQVPELNSILFFSLSLAAIFIFKRK